MANYKIDFAAGGRMKHFHRDERQFQGHVLISVLVLGLLFIANPSVLFAQGAGAWHTSGNQILDSNNQPVRIAGVNWYGFETTDEIAHGLWAQDYHTVINEIKSNGYNVIRLPFSNQMVETPSNPTNFTQNVNGQAVNTDLAGLNALQIMDKIVAAAGAAGLRVILDNHRSEAGNSNEANGLWYTSAYPDSAWVNDWKTLAARYKSFTDASGNPIVIGMDLRNEPHVLANGGSTGACWTGDSRTNGCPTSNTAQNWPAAATRAGNAILAINPHLLIFVEGNDCYGTDCGWQGGNLEGVATNPITLNVANQLAYSAHDYGPDLFAQSWFNSSTTFASLSAVWTKFWGYVSANNIAPVWVGEFGTTNNASDLQSSSPGSQGQWFQSLVNFLQNNPNLNWTYWALNGEDSFALLNSQYNGIASSTKQSMLATIQFPLGGGGSPNFSLSASPTSLTINQGASGTSTISITPSNGFSGSVSLSASGLPTGVTATFSANPTTTGSTLTLSASSTAATGTATVTITGTSGSLTHTTTVALTVNPITTSDFSLSASPTSLTVARGASGTSTITITRTGSFSGSVAFAASGLPSGVTASFSPSSTTGTSSALTLSASSTAATGAATVTITGSSGSLTHNTSLTLTVTGGSDFSLSASPTSLSVAQGASGTSTISITRTGSFSGSVAFTASGLPSGVTASFSPSSTTGTSSVLTLSASSTATAGATTVTVTGTSGSLSHTAAIALTVTTGNGTGGVTITPVVNSSSPYFNEEDVKLSNTGNVTALTVTIVVQRTTGISFGGQYNTVGGSITQGNASTSSTVTYTFTLNSGQTLGPNSYTFAAQTSGTGTTHPTSGDTFTVTYTTGGQNFTQTGHF